MCGIIGFTGKNISSEKYNSIEAGLSVLNKRGPDDSGITKFDQSILGHRRLSIIDINGGHQPMKDSSGKISITFNGEIYNYKELKEELRKDNFIFKTESDTEVILGMYIKHGENCVDKLDGMFAFAIWDDEKKELFLARDRFGEKPLYYAEKDREILFSSEIKAILATKMIEPKLDLVSIDNYLGLSYIPPWRSIYKTIKPIPPAHCAIFKDGKLTLKKYWKLKNRKINIPKEEVVKQVKKLIQSSVKSRMIADVEVGAFLSGGIDSSIITMLAQKESVGRKIKTFSAQFEDYINELPYAEKIASQYETEHKTKNIHTDLAKSLRDVSLYFDEPFADSSSIPTHLLSEFTRESVKVALSGDGGDELFFGYGHYRTHFYLNPFRRLFRYLKYLISKNPSHLINYFSARERKKLWKDPSVIEDSFSKYLDFSEAKTYLQKINIADFSMTLPGDILTKVDRASMLNSLEVRSPFLQHELAEFVYNLPDKYKTNKSNGKLILSDTFSDSMPKWLFTRKKQGFGAPVEKWLKKNELKILIEEMKKPESRIREFINENYLSKIIDKFNSGETHLAKRIWVLLSLEMWLKTHPESRV